MNRKLINQLNAMSDAEFRQLDIRIQLAKNSRNLIQDFKLTDEEFCKEMDLPLNKLKSFLNGGYEYTLNDIATQQAVHFKLLNIKALAEAVVAAKETVKVTGL